MWQSYQNKTARLIEWGITFQLFSDTFNSKQLIQAIPGNLKKKNPSSVPPFQEERTADSDDGIPDGIRRRTDKGYATCYGSGREKYDSSALTRRNLCVG